MQLKQILANRRATRGNYFDMTKDSDAPTTKMFDTSMDESMANTAHDYYITVAEQADELMQKQQQMKKKVEEHLDDSQPKDIAHQMASSSNQPMKEEL